MSMLDRISTQLVIIEQKLLKMFGETDSSFEKSASLHSDNQDPLQANIDTLHQSIQRLGILSELTKEVKGKYLLQEVVDVTLDAFWRRTALTFAVLILGEQELGPYHYHGVRGEPAPWRELLGECPFPLSGSLAQAILRRRMPSEPDYLLFDDLSCERPTSEEFPWLPQQGTLLFIPLRFGAQTIGAVMVGSAQSGNFQNDMLCKDLCDIGNISAEAIRTAQMHHEATTNAEKLVNAQLLTREIVCAKDYVELVNILTTRISDVNCGVTAHLYLEPSLHHLSDPSFTPTTHAANDSQLQLITLNETSAEDAPHSLEAMHLLEWAIEAGQPLFYEPNSLHTQNDHPFYNETGSAVIVPIADGDRTYGVLHLVDVRGRRQFDESDMVVFRTLTNCAAAAFAKFQLAQDKQNSLLSALHPLVGVVESRFAALKGHNERAAHNAALLAKSVGMSDGEVLQIRVATAFHDIGLASLNDDDLKLTSSTEFGALPLTTSATLAASYEAMLRVGIDENIGALMTQVKVHWQALEVEGWPELFSLGPRTNTSFEKRRLSLYADSVNEETQELVSVVRDRLHQNHRHYYCKQIADTPSQPSSHHTHLQSEKPFGDFSSENDEIPDLDRSAQAKPFPNRKQSEGNASITDNGVSGDVMDSRAAQIIILAQTLDEFLIYSSLGRSEDLALANVFLQRCSCPLIDDTLTQTLHSLVTQELALLP